MNPLASETIGSGPHRLVFLHGFTQSRGLWREIARRVVARLPDVECLLVDLPGHGGSAHVRVDLPGCARLVAQLGGEAVYVGYSLGARVALRVVVDHPGLATRAVVVSATAGIDDDKTRSERRAQDDALAARVEAIGVEKFLDEWLAQPMFADLPRGSAGRDDRSLNSVDGLAASLRLCGQGRQEPLWTALASCRRPVHALAGSRDPKYVALARRIAATVPAGTLRIVDGCGHSVVLERPDDVVEEIVYRIASPAA